MATEFRRPVGAAADVAELEYVSALMQTDMPHLRADGSVQDVDIVRFLRSRYGIETTRTVMYGLVSGDREEKSIDLMEMVAILLIPTLVKSAKAEGGLPLPFFFSKRRMSLLPPEVPPDGIRPPAGLIHHVLTIILHDAMRWSMTEGLSPRLDKSLVRRILTSYGETELAADDGLLEDMVRAAGGGVGGRRYLNGEALAFALTGDVMLYDETSETEDTTHYSDVFKTHLSGDNIPKGEENGDEAMSENGADAFTWGTALALDGTEVKELREKRQPVHKKFTASAVDFAAGAYRWKAITVGLWLTFMVGYFGYGYKFAISQEYYQICPDGTENRSLSLGCRFLISTAQWFVVFLAAWFLGLTFIGFGSIGNEIESDCWWKPWIGIAAVSIQGVLPLYLLHKSDMVSMHIEDRIMYFAYIALALLVVYFQFINFVGRCIPQSFLLFHPRIKQLFLPGGIVAEAANKKAAAFKMNTMTRNALDLSVIDENDVEMESHFGKILLAYSKLGGKFEVIGGAKWAWKQWWNGDLSAKQGIWLHSRLLAGNSAMIIVAVFVLLQGICLTQEAGESFSEESVSEVYKVITNGFLTSQLLISDIIVEEAATSVRVLVEDSFMSTCANEIMSLYHNQSFQLVAKHVLDTAAERAKEDFYPAEQYMVVVPVAIGTAVAFLAAIRLTVVYIPSVTSTTLQLRAGVIPTFHDAEFYRHRGNAELITILLGSMFWGTLFSSVTLGGLVGALVFLFMWQVSEPYVLRYLAFLAGIAVLVAFRVVVFHFLRTTFYDAFYRRQPALVNIISLALEAANFAISVGFIIARSVKLLVISALYIGRIDTYFLAPGVGTWGRFEMDQYPSIFLKDILSHEAHRHPYVEIMGTMFMLKLRYRENFGRTAGSCWRLIFVFALMPWLSKYRIMTRPEKRSNVGRFDPEYAHRNSMLLSIGLAAISRSHPKARLPQNEQRMSQDERISWLEDENARLKKELADLRQHTRLQVHAL